MAYHLKTRIAFAVSLLVLFFMALLGWLGLSYFEKEFKNAALSHLADSLSVSTSGISSRLEHALQTLEIIKETLPHDILNDPGTMQLFLEEQSTDLLTFDNGLILYSPKGRLLAINPRQDDVIGMDLSFRDYFKITMQTRQPYISAPFKSKQQHQHPIIMLTQPILNSNNEVIAILAGSFDLYGNNFLQTLINNKEDDVGYYLMLDERETLVIRPNRKNVLRSAETFFPEERISEFLTASRGGITRLSMDGQEMIGAFQRVAPLNWTLVALSPLEKRYQPIHQARLYLIIALAALSLITVLAVRLLSKRLISPLVDLTEKVRHQTDQLDEPLNLETGSYEELGDLASSIQRLMTDVSAKRKGLKDQLTFLQNLIDTIPGPIFYKDIEYRYMGCNRAFEKYIGIPREELVGKSVFDIAPPNLAKVYHQADVDLWESGKEQTYEASVKYADNSVHDVIYYKKVFKDVNGDPAGMIGTFLDITDRKQYEQALSTSEKRFRLLVENAADAFFLHDEEGNILDVNNQACLSLGYSRQELMGMKVPDVSADFNLESIKQLQEAMMRGETATIEDRHRRKDGSIFPVEVRLCHTDQDGGMVIALARDISARKRDEAALQRALHDAQTAKGQVDNILRCAADGLVVTDRRNRVTHINQIAEEMLGVSASEIVGQAFTKLFIDQKLREQAKAFLNEADMDSHQFDFKLNLSGSHPSSVIQARSSMLRTKAGKPSGVVVLLRDVTRERELDQVKSEFISTAAHEMRTPISVIMGYIEMLLDNEQFGSFPAKSQREFLGEVYRKAEALSQIVDDLFDISRIEAGLPLPIETAECDLSQVIRNVVAHYENHAKNHQFEFSLEEVTKVCVDCNKMSQVFENLISNAVKYSPKGGTIKVSSTLREGTLLVEIKDQGSGMSDDQVKRVFDKFYRVDSSDTAVSGLGLGMHIVKAIVEGHGGRIWVTSAVGEGTCVSLEIPLEQESSGS